MTPTPSFESLKAFLIGLGCQFHSAPDAHVTFKHPASGALIVLHFYRDNEAVSPTDLAIARRVLDEFGVLPRDEFDAALSGHSLAG
jgi:hypothetical protein